MVEAAGIPDVCFGLVGVPGVGKTEACVQAAAALGLPHYEIRPAELEPVDFRGIPVPDLDKLVTRWLRAEFWPTEKCWITFDELTLASPDVTAPLLKILLGRAIGDFRLHPETVVAWTGNLAQHKTGAHKVPTALGSRSIIMEVEPSYDEWRQYYLGREDHHGAVLEFLDREPQAFCPFDPRCHGNQPSPRSWVRAGQLAHVTTSPVLFAGVLGDDVGQAFARAVAEYRPVPEVADVLSGNAEAPTDLRSQSSWRRKLAVAAVQPDADPRIAELVERLTDSDQVIVMQAIAQSEGGSRVLLSDAWTWLVDKHADDITAARLNK